jgi:hypothetical protein
VAVRCKVAAKLGQHDGKKLRLIIAVVRAQAELERDKEAKSPIPQGFDFWEAVF